MECVAVSGRGNWQALSCACGLAKFSNDRDFVAPAKRSSNSVSGRVVDSPSGARSEWRVGPQRSGSAASCETSAVSYRSGQTGQTVNLMAYAFAGSNPALTS